MLLLVIKLLLNKAGLNSRNSSTPPSKDSNRDKTKRDKSRQEAWRSGSLAVRKPGGQEAWRSGSLAVRKDMKEKLLLKLQTLMSLRIFL